MFRNVFYFIVASIYFIGAHLFMDFAPSLELSLNLFSINFAYAMIGVPISTVILVGFLIFFALLMSSLIFIEYSALKREKLLGKLFGGTMITMMIFAFIVFTYKPILEFFYWNVSFALQPVFENLLTYFLPLLLLGFPFFIRLISKRPLFSASMSGFVIFPMILLFFSQLVEKILLMGLDQFGYFLSDPETTHLVIKLGTTIFFLLLYLLFERQYHRLSYPEGSLDVREKERSEGIDGIGVFLLVVRLIAYIVFVYHLIQQMY